MVELITIGKMQDLENLSLKNELSAITDHREPKLQVGMKIEEKVWPVSTIQPLNAMTGQ